MDDTKPDPDPIRMMVIDRMNTIKGSIKNGR